MEYVNLDDDRERHWRMVFEDNDGGVENKVIATCYEVGYIYK